MNGGTIKLVELLNCRTIELLDYRTIGLSIGSHIFVPLATVENYHS